MPSGDNSRMWFPEMLDELKQTWRPEMTWSEVREVCLIMGHRLEGVRKSLNINTRLKTPCSCGGVLAVSSKITIRSLLFALKKVAIINEDDFARLDKEWKSYQRKNNLNGYCEPKKKKP